LHVPVEEFKQTLSAFVKLVNLKKKEDLIFGAGLYSIAQTWKLSANFKLTPSRLSKNRQIQNR
jgi:hypothetical protein